MAPFVALERPDGIFLLPTSIDPKLFVEGTRGEFVVLPRVLKALLHAGRPPERGTLVDVGAHVGTTTIPPSVPTVSRRRSRSSPIRTCSSCSARTWS